MVVGPTVRVQPYPIGHLASSWNSIHGPLCGVLDSNSVSGAHPDQSCVGASGGVFGVDEIGSRVDGGAEMGVGCVCGGAGGGRGVVVGGGALMWDALSKFLVKRNGFCRIYLE